MVFRQVAFRDRPDQLDNLVAAYAAEVPDSLMKSALFPNPDYLNVNIRGSAEAAEKEPPQFLRDGEASRLARMSLPKIEYSPPKTSVVKPADGALLRGQAISSGEGVQRLPDNVGGLPNQKFWGATSQAASRLSISVMAGWGSGRRPNLPNGLVYRAEHRQGYYRTFEHKPSRTNNRRELTVSTSSSLGRSHWKLQS